MGRRIVILFCAVCLLFTGCAGWMSGSYSSEKPHQVDRQWQTQDAIPVTGYTQLIEILSGIVEDGVESATLSVSMMRQETLPDRMADAIAYTMAYNPVAGYAVREITFELGRRGGYDIAVVKVEYNSNRMNLYNLKRVRGVETANQVIKDALDTCAAGVVLLVDDYSPMDYVAIVQRYAQENPNLIMEVPKVTAKEFPESGSKRLVEIAFGYQTARQSLQDMQAYVEPIFQASALFVGGALQDRVKYAQLYSLLISRNPYVIETSITPAYSLLRHGVGDSKAFATVYAAMCREAGLECRVVSGTRRGEPWFWNIINEDGVYRHLDLVQCCRAGEYQIKTDAQMAGYVWDYSAHPKCAT